MSIRKRRKVLSQNRNKRIEQPRKRKMRRDTAADERRRRKRNTNTKKTRRRRNIGRGGTTVGRHRIDAETITAAETDIGTKVKSSIIKLKNCLNIFKPRCFAHK